MWRRSEGSVKVNPTYIQGKNIWEEGIARAKAPRQEMLGVECCSVRVSGKEGMESVKRRG